MLIRSLPRGLFILLVFCGQEVCAQEATKEPFYHLNYALRRGPEEG